MSSDYIMSFPSYIPSDEFYTGGFIWPAAFIYGEPLKVKKLEAFPENTHKIFETGANTECESHENVVFASVGLDRCRFMSVTLSPLKR